MPTTKKLNREEADYLKQQGYVVDEGQEVLVADPPKPGVGGVVARSAAASALPTLAGGAGFAGGMQAGAMMGLPAGPLGVAGGLVLGGAGGYLAGKLTSKAQEAMLPDSVKQTLAEDYAARPVASTIGGLITLPLGGFNPSNPSTIGKGLSGIGKYIGGLRGNQIGIAERQAAINMAAGAGIGGIQEAVMQPLEGREFDPKAIALNAAIGATFTKPNAIGRKLGFHNIPERTVDDPNKLSRSVGQHVEPDPISELRQPTVHFTDTQLEALNRATGVDIGKAKSAKSSAKTMASLLENEAPVVSRETDPDILNTLVKQGRLVEHEVEVQKPKEGITTPLGEEVRTGLRTKNLAGPSEKYVEVLANEVLGAQNIKVSADGNLKSADGKPLKGTALLPNDVREVVFNPNSATLDTLPHEGLHYFRTELEQAASRGDKEAQRLLSKWDATNKEGLDAYNARRVSEGLTPNDAHEFAVSENGLEFVKQQFNLNKETGMQKWWNDTKALFREKYSKDATVEDLRRAINYRFVNEQTKGKFVGAGVKRDQPQETGDYERYTELQSKIKDMIEKGDFESGELQKVWAESESLKNKNKGMPPVKERNQPDEKIPFGPTENPDEPKTWSKETWSLVEKEFNQILRDESRRKAGLKSQTIDERIQERNQPDEEGLKRGQAFQDELQGRALERIANAQDQIGVSDSAELINEMEQSAAHLGDLSRNQPEGEGLHRKDKNFIIPGDKPEYPSWIQHPESPQARAYAKAREEYQKNPIAKEYADFKDYIRNTYFKGEEPFSWAADDLRNPPMLKGEITDPDIGKVSEKDIAEYRRLKDASDEIWSPLARQAMKLGDRSERNREENTGLSWQPFHDQRNQPEGEGLSRTDPSAKSFLPGFASAIDKVEQKVSQPIAQAARNWASRKDNYWGKGQLMLSDLEKLSKGAVNSAFAKMRSMFREEVSKAPNMNAEEMQAVEIIRDYMGWNADERRKNGQLIEGREAGKNPWYVNDTMNEQARHTLLEKPNSDEARYLKTVWADYVMRESKGRLKRANVVRNISNYVDAMGSRDRHYTSIDFGATRKAQGYGMPEVMRETDAIKALGSYARRAANDMAFFKEIESNTPIAAALKLRDPLTGNFPPEVEGAPSFHTTKEVKDMMAWMTGTVNENTIRHPFITSASRLTNNMLLGAPTGLRDLASALVFNVPYMNKFSDLGNFAKGILNFRNESRNALEFAARQPQIDKLAFADIADSPNRLLNAIQKAATFARKGQGREFIENLSRDISFSIGKEFARENVLGAKAGHEASKKFLERFSSLIEGDVTKMEGAELETALNQMAKNVVDATQGTYGPTGLPNFTSEGQLAPFLSLTKWSLEKSNTIFKDVVKPFYTGENMIPLLTYTLGSVLTGAGIQALNKALSGRKGNDPTWEESLQKGDAEAMVSQLATLMQLGSYGGLVGDGMKILTDASKGKTPRNPLSFPLYSSTVNNAEMIADAVGAMQQGEDPMNILYHLSLDLMSSNVQNAKQILNRVEGEETKRKEDFRDERVFQELEGKRGTDIPRVNRYAGMEEKEFKREKDLSKAAGMIPSLVSRAKGEAESLEELKMKLQSLKQNNYQTFPNPKTQPQAFQKYYKFLVDTQGEESAQQRLADYLKQNQMNRAKASLVPSM